MRASQVFNSLEDNARQYEKALRNAEQNLSGLTDQELDIRAGILSVLNDLAALQIDTKTSVKEVANQLLIRRQEEVALREQLVQVESGISITVEALRALQERIDSQVHEAKQRLANDSEYAELQKQLGELKVFQSEMVLRVGEIQAECESKLQAYSESPLYVYLIKQEYGNPAAYSRNGITRALDAWIAGLCNYSANRVNESTLKDMLAQNGGGIEERQKVISRLESQVDDRFLKVTGSVQLDSLKSQHADAAASLRTKKKEANSIHSVLDRYATKSDDRYIQVKALLVRLMDQASVESLMEMAALTPSEQDDRQVLELRKLRERLTRVKADADKLRVERDSAKMAYQRAKEIVRSVEREGLNLSGYKYRSGLDVGGLFAEYMSGSIAQQSFLDSMRQNRVEIPIEKPASTYSGYSQRNSSANDSGSLWSTDSGSSGGSSFFSSGDSGGSEFSTTDSF